MLLRGDLRAAPIGVNLSLFPTGEMDTSLGKGAAACLGCHRLETLG